ncbi:MAG: hypothetical protein ACJA1E_001621 [Paracoccaceae bacterium]
MPHQVKADSWRARNARRNKEAGPLEPLIYIGALLSAAGLCGIIWCIVIVARARKAGLDDQALRDKLQKVVSYNLGAFLMSAIGLMMVVVGILLG